MNCFDIRQQQFCGGYFCIYSPPVFAIITHLNGTASTDFPAQPAKTVDSYALRGTSKHILIAHLHGLGWKPVPISSRGVLIPSQRLRLEAYTLSNRGRSLRIADSQSAGWKPVPKHNLYSLLIAQVGYWLPASGE